MLSCTHSFPLKPLFKILNGHIWLAEAQPSTNSKGSLAMPHREARGRDAPKRCSNFLGASSRSWYGGQWGLWYMVQPRVKCSCCITPKIFLAEDIRHETLPCNRTAPKTIKNWYYLKTLGSYPFYSFFKDTASQHSVRTACEARADKNKAHPMDGITPL